MNNRSIAIAVLCGLIAAVLFVSPLSLGSLGMGLSSFTAMPLFVAVLGFGTVIGMIACAVAALAVGIFMGPISGFSVLLATLAPAVWIGHSAGLSRDDSGVQEWFPLSQILFRLAVISAGIVLIIGVITGYSHQWALDQVTAMMSQFADVQNQSGAGGAGGAGPLISQQEIETRAKDIATLIPIIMPVSILLLMIINLRLAERFVRRRGWILRPKDDLPSAVNMPPMAAIILIGAVVLSFLNNDLGTMAQVIAGAFGGAFLMVGLATIHFITRGLAVRPFLLPIVYIVLLFSRFIAPIFALIGVAESLLSIRARFAGPPKST